jgi:hypothetical protein
MKYIFALFSISAFAGLPQNDFVIDAIRESFKRGFSPSTQRTLPNKGLWVCGMYSTIVNQSGTVGVTLGGIKFNSTINGLMGASAYHMTDVPYYEFNDSKASYRDLDGRRYFHFVRESHGGLVIERATRRDDVELKSVIDPTLSVTQYSYCLPYNKSSGREKVFNYKWDTILKY